MKIRYMEEFKEGFLRIVDLLSNPSKFYNNLREVIQSLEQGKDTERLYS